MQSKRVEAVEFVELMDLSNINKWTPFTLKI